MGRIISPGRKLARAAGPESWQSARGRNAFFIGGSRLVALSLELLANKNKANTETNHEQRLETETYIHTLSDML